MAVNGAVSPPPLELRAGKRYRFRFIGITPAPNLEITLERNGQPGVWRPIAKDGADLIERARIEPSKFNVFPGETYDFEFHSATTGTFRLTALQPFFKLQTVALIAVRKQ